MFKRIIALMLFCLSLFALGCSGSNNGGESSLPGEDDKSYCNDYKGIDYSTTLSPIFAATDHTLYLLTDHIVNFTDKEYKDWMPLCARPDCKHDNADCNAYIDSECLVLYDHYLYYVEGSGQHSSDKYSVNLCRMKLNGTEHETVCDLREMLEPEHSYKVDSSDWQIQTTNKFIIIKSVLYEQLSSDAIVNHINCFAFDMETQQFVPILTEYSEDPEFSGFVMYEGVDNHAYGAVCYIREDYNSDGTYKIVDIDLAAGATREICEFTGEIMYYQKEVCIADGKLFFIEQDTVKDPSVGYTDKELQQLYVLDLETGEIEMISEEPAIYAKWRVPDAAAGYWYSTVGLGDELNGTYICDMNREQIAFIPASDYPEETGGKLSIGIITDDYIFAMGRSKSGGLSDEILPVWYLNKADIGTDNLAWRRWEP